MAASRGGGNKGFRGEGQKAMELKRVSQSP